MRYKILIQPILITLSLGIAHSSFAGQLGQWNYTNSLNVARSENVAVISRDTIIYTFGGVAYINNTPNPVERATIRPDGTLSPWVEESSQMVEARAGAVGFATDSYVYAIGGDAGPGVGFSTTAERAPINLDGTLGQWTTISVLPTGFWESTLIKDSTFLYIIGGYQGSSDIFQSTLNNDGSLGTWTLLSSQLAPGSTGPGTILINSTIYVVGGENAGGFNLRNVNEAVLSPAGEFGVFTTISYTGAYHVTPVLIYDGQYLNVIGGWLEGNVFEREERAMLNPDGSLGAWEAAPYLEDERQQFGYVQTSTDAYVIGGFDGGDSPNVEYAPLIPTGIDKRDWEMFE